MSLKITRSSEQTLGMALVDAADQSSTLEVKKKNHACACHRICTGISALMEIHSLHCSHHWFSSLDSVVFGKNFTEICLKM